MAPTTSWPEENLTSQHGTFQLFSQLPAEIRAKIWLLALSPHVVRWIRVDDNALPSSNSFPYSPQHDSILRVSCESREIGLHLGKYVTLGASGNIFYSPVIDYLHLDPAWRQLPAAQLARDPFSSLSLDVQSIRKIMVNPNYTDDRMKPGLALERLSSLQEILVVADEKSVGLKGKFMLASVYDLQKYFEGIKRQHPEIRIPYIAVGCLGWVGEEKMRLSHPSEHKRELVAVFDSQAELKEHLVKMRDEEVNFLQTRFHGKQTGFKLNFKPGHSMSDLVGTHSNMLATTSDDALTEVEAEESTVSPDYEGSPMSRADSGSSTETQDSLPTYSQVMNGEDT